MSNSSFPKTLVITLVLAVVAYVTAPYLNMDGLSLGLGLFLGGLIGGLLSLGKSKTPAAAPSRPAKHRAPSTDARTIFVGNLAFRASRGALNKLFSEYGEVRNVRIVTDRNTRKPKGYGFVEMAASDADKAINALNGQEFYGRELKVSEANERKN